MILKSLTTLILKVKMIPTFAYAPFAQIRFKLLRECRNGLFHAVFVRITPTWIYQSLFWSVCNAVLKIAPWISIRRADHVKVAFARNMLMNMVTAEIKRSTWQQSFLMIQRKQLFLKQFTSSNVPQDDLIQENPTTAQQDLMTSQATLHSFLNTLTNVNPGNYNIMSTNWVSHWIVPARLNFYWLSIRWWYYKPWTWASIHSIQP